MKKISTRLWGLMLCLVFIAMGLLWLVQVQFLQTFYMDRQTNNIVRHAKELSLLLISDPNVDKVKEKLEELNLKFNASIDIYTDNGTLQYSSDTYAQLMLGMNKREVIQETLKKGEILKIMAHTKLSFQVLLSGITIVDENGDSRGVILIMAPLAPVKEAVGIIKEQLIYIMLILIAISFFLSYFFARAFTKPILDIKNGAVQLAKGNLDVGFHVRSKDELGDLADTMNDLAGQLNKTEQMRKDLIANVSHEFRTPLSLIHGYAETVRDVTGPNEEKRTKQLNIIMEESERLSEMVNDMLDYSSLQSNTYSYDFQTVALDITLRSVVNRFDYFRQKTNIDLQTELSKEHVLVFADEKRISQVFYNLINNAFVHSGTEKPIIARIVEKDETYRVEIENRGKLIPEEELESIWERFHKIDRQRNTGGGSGLGLAIVRNILESHGASYGVRSNEKDGTIFWFELKKQK